MGDPMSGLMTPTKPRRRNANFASRAGSKTFLNALDTAIRAVASSQGAETVAIEDTLLGLAATADRAGACDAVRERIRAALLWACALDGPCGPSDAVDRLLEVRLAASA
jgi:hypothetical protein